MVSRLSMKQTNDQDVCEIANANVWARALFNSTMGDDCERQFMHTMERAMGDNNNSQM